MIGDTIFAVASPPGASARGIVRISGPQACATADAVLDAPVARERSVQRRRALVLGFPVDAMVVVMPGPRSYTGEDVVELHVLGSPLLLEHLQSQLRVHARDASAGEFTRRAFENGKLDLAGAEAVLALICAAGEGERRFALYVLDGGLAAAVDAARSAVLDARALLEAGLDFEPGETGAVDATQWLPVVQGAAAALRALRAGIPEAAPGGELLLAGAANAGKSSLCNALAGRDAVLVGDEAGTTRDVLAVEVARGVTVLDAPGDVASPSDLDAAALALRDRLAPRATGALAVIDATAPVAPRTDLPLAAVVWTKCDLAPPRPGALALPEVPAFAVSSRTGEGIAALRAFLGTRRGVGPAPARRRIADRIERALAALERASQGARQAQPDELVAVELGDAIDELDAVHGRATPEDLLDRIFAGFCVGK